MEAYNIQDCSSAEVNMLIKFFDSTYFLCRVSASIEYSLSIDYLSEINENKLLCSILGAFFYVLSKNTYSGLMALSACL